MSKPMLKLINSNQFNSIIDNQGVTNVQPMSSVTIIMVPRPEEKQDYDILFVTRRPTKNDAFSGHICFPGGKIQKGQTAMQAAIREAYEQIGVTLTQKNLSSQVEKIFYCFVRPGLVYTIKVFIFMLDSKPQLNLNKNEIDQYKWLSLRQFLVNAPVYFRKIKVNLPIYILKDTLDETEETKEEINKYFRAIDYPALQLGFPIALYGLTFDIVFYLLAKGYYYGLRNNTIPKKIKKNLQQFIQFGRTYITTVASECQKKDQYQKITRQNFQEVFAKYTELVPKPKL